MNTISFEKRHFSDRLWDMWCVCSVIGIWPRYIEPRIITTTKHIIPIPNLHSAIRGLKIVQISDLHLHSKISQTFLDKLVKKVNCLQPDLLVVTGDFFCNSKNKDPNRLHTTLNRFQAKSGCFAVFGNHDYQQPISINENGEYDLIYPQQKNSLIGQGFQRLFSPLYPIGRATPRASQIPPHPELVAILEKSPFKILDNRTERVSLRGASINVTGLGEHMLGKCLPDKAFSGYREEFPGVVLSHNPDSVPLLQNYPGNLILSGHTHGAQVNLPCLWNHFTLMEQPRYKRGLFQIPSQKQNGDERQIKWLYVNRGVGSTMPFRWFSPPEIAVFTLVSAK